MVTCVFCGKCYQVINNHKPFCKMNPNRSDKRSGVNSPRHGKKGGNQHTKAAELGVKVVVSSEVREKLSKAGKNIVWTKERRNRHSQAMIEAVKRNPDSYSASNVSGRVKIYEFDGMKFKGQWELKVAKCLKASGIKYTNIVKPIEYTWQDSTHLYFPDFYLEDYDLYIEVKGFERGRDLCKWKVLDNLVILKEDDISKLDHIPIIELLI